MGDILSIGREPRFILVGGRSKVGEGFGWRRNRNGPDVVFRSFARIPDRVQKKLPVGRPGWPSQRISFHIQEELFRSGSRRGFLEEPENLLTPRHVSDACLLYTSPSPR